MMLRAPTDWPHAPPSRAAGVRVGWADSPCPLCKARDPELVLEAADPTAGPGRGLVFAVVQCRHCELAYTNPRPDADSMSRFYPADYRPHRRARKIRRAGKRVSWWARLSGRSSPERDGGLEWVGQGRLLDFGCGGGNYLRRMADHGWRVTGLDAAVGAVATVQSELGLPALVGSLPHPELEPASFDVVTMWHSLEHVHDPLQTLRDSFRLLIPGGRLVVAVPNRESFAAWAFGPAWFGLDLPRHLTHFTPSTLRTMLHVAGFSVDRIEWIRHADWLRSSAKLACREPGAPRWQRALRWKPLAKLATIATHAARSSDCILAVARRPE